MKTSKVQKNIGRLQSLDALRGFDMLWIVGGQKIIYALSILTGYSFFEWFHNQLKHVEWHGFALYDLIFPLFLFLSGVSVPFSFEKRLSKGETKKDLYCHAIKRVFLLFLFGLIYNGLFKLDFENLRYGSVLGRIGVAWFIAAVLYLNTHLRGMILWAIGLLTVYTLLMLYFPVPGYGAGDLSLEGNFASYIDKLLMPGKFYFEGILEPEGIITTLPAIVTALLGMFTGVYIKNSFDTSKPFKVFIGLLIGGILGLFLGKMLGWIIPINKWLWTSSFTIYSAGWSLLLLAVFHLLFDIWQFRKLSFFFVVIGMNPITIYMVQHKIINFHIARDFFFSGLMNILPENISPLVGGIGYVACVWTFLYVLYYNKIFLKV